MVKRDHEARKTSDPYNGRGLSNRLDKGFPYDDGDNSIDNQSPNWRKKAPSAAVQVGQLNGQNITNNNLKNLVRDTASPVTQELIQLESDLDKKDSDGAFALLGNNVTFGALKNLITDKPSPITVKLADKKDSDGAFALLGNNVTFGALKNLITDKPSPITVKLAQTGVKSLIDLEKY